MKGDRTKFRARQGERLGAQIERRRRQLGLSCARAAALIGVTRWTLGLWEQGKQEPAARYGSAIARFLT
ncbi:helix-turn-helix transcriptional regulator [Caulobacter ginsengisoli]|uniref:helix-turn-helix transcriptional regulator n=1 Tax=Caulobacter ginsengisoli TaxID=400775 RepID=UPI0035217E3F